MVYKDYVVLYGRNNVSEHFKTFGKAKKVAKQIRKKHKNLTITIDMITHYDRNKKGERVKIINPGETSWSQHTVKVI